MSPFRSGWTALKNSSLGNAYRIAKWKSLATREKRSVRALASAAGISPISSEHPIFSLSKFDHPTLYILGNGGSVNDLSLANFAEIRSGVSIGINAWPIHPFQPNFYSFEYDRLSFTPDQELEYLVRLAEAQLVEHHSQGLLFLRPGKPASLRAVVPLSPASRPKAVMYGRANLLAQNLQALRRDLEEILELIRGQRTSVSVLPDNGSSIIRMIFLGLVAGFRNIVLVGVDLNGSAYFWEDTTFDTGKKVEVRLVNRSSSDSLLTEETLDRPFPTSIFIAELSRLALRILDATIACSNPNSALADHLPIHSFGSSC